MSGFLSEALLCAPCCCSVAKSSLTLCDPMKCSLPGFPVLHYLLEFAQAHVHWVGDAIQPSHPLLSPSSHVLNLSHHQGFFPISQFLHQMAKLVECQLQHQSFQWIFRLDFLWDWLVWSPCCPRDSWVFSRTTIQKHQFFDIQRIEYSSHSSLWSKSHICKWLLEKP